MEARLSSAMLVSALQRRAESQGGFAAILAKGDPTAGSILVLLVEKGRKALLLERTLGPAGAYLWQPVSGQALANEDEFAKFLRRRRDSDPDIWLIELDIASAERFAAEMNSHV